MKKIVTLILALLPIFLIVVISFAGRIFSIYGHIYVERVVWVNTLEQELPSNYILRLSTDSEYQTQIKVFPELASNKAVTYYSQDVSIATIDANGNIQTNNTDKYGATTLIVKTVEGAKVASLILLVSEDSVRRVEMLTPTEITLKIGQVTSLKANIIPETALNKNVDWTSSDTTVATVSANGVVTTKTTGTATVTVTTRDGEHTAETVITVEEGPPFEFSPNLTGGLLYQSDEQILDLAETILINDTSLTIQDINFTVISGVSYATIDNNNKTITFLTAGKFITVLAYIGEYENPTYSTELLLKYN